jgi:uncharacterized protein YbjT (DUF2867 family)
VIVLTAKDLSASDYARLHGSVERILQKGTDPGSIVREVLGVLESARPAVARTRPAGPRLAAAPQGGVSAMPNEEVPAE